jgi:HlyD family secretion protein
MTEERKQLNRVLYWLGAGILLVAVFFTVRSLARDREPVRAVRVSRSILVNTVSTNGRVEPEMNYELHAPLAAIVTAIYVQPGDQVSAGKLLMQLNDVEARAKVAAAESGVKAAQAAVEAATHNGTQQERQQAESEIARARIEQVQARHDLDALIRLNATGAASVSEVSAARQRSELAETNLRASEEIAKNRFSAVEIERARSSLADAEAGLTEAREILAETSIHAPMDGTVYSLSAGKSEYVEAGKMVLELADLSHERVRAYFDEPEIGKLAVGQKIQIKWLAKPGRVWSAHIIRVPVTVIAFGTRSVGEVLVQIDDPDSGLLPDTNVTVTVTTSSEPNSMAIPREALHAENGKYFVYKVTDDQMHLMRTPVTIGTISLTQVAVLNGLQDGDQVATGSTSGQPLSEGIPIKVVQ